MSKIEAALLEATGQKTEKRGEDRQKYLLRLALAANEKLSDEEWDALESTGGAQDWVTAAIEADNKEKDIEDFPDREDEEEDEAAAAGKAGDADDGDDDAAAEEAEDDNDEEEEVDTKSKKKPGGSGKSKTKPAAKTPAKKEPAKAKTAAKTKPAPAKKAAAGKSAGGPKKDSMRRALKRIVVKNPKLSVDDLIGKLEAKGYDAPSKVTVTTIRADTRDTIKVMNEANLAEVEL